MSITIRRARLEDLPEVCRLERACFKHPYPPQLLHMFMSLYPELFLVAECGGKIVGYVCGVVRTDGYGHIVSICVDPGYRRRGIGRALMEAIERAFMEIFDVCRFRLEVRVSNVPAIKLYEKLGFKIVRKLESYYLDGEDAYLMVKDLCVDKSKNVGS